MKQYALILFALCSQINFGSESEMNTILREQQARIIVSLTESLRQLPRVTAILEEQMTEFDNKQKSVPTCKVISLVAKSKNIQALPAIKTCDNPTIESNGALVDQKNSVTEILSEIKKYRKELRLEKELIQMVAARQALLAEQEIESK